MDVFRAVKIHRGEFQRKAVVLARKVKFVRCRQALAINGLPIRQISGLDRLVADVEVRDIDRMCIFGYMYLLWIERRSEEHTSELQSRENLVCRLLLEKKK